MKSATAGLDGRRRASWALVATATLIALAVLLPAWASAVPGPTDLVLSKSDSADPVTQDSNFTYTIQVENTGANDATGVSVADTLPSSVDFVSMSTTAGNCSRTGRDISCALGQVNTGATVTIAIVVKAKKQGTASNTATLTSVDDTNAANNSDTESTVINKKPAAPKKKGKKKGKGKASCAAPTISGTGGNDTLVGTAGPDVIRGFAGGDRISGNGGSDLICADRGPDTVFGGSSADTAIGGAGRDRLIGGTGGDTLKGKSGRDKLRGQRGNDTLNGGKQRDNCKGGAGRDALSRCP